MYLTNLIKTKQKDLISQVLFGWGGRIRTSEMAGPKPAALPLGDAPIVRLRLLFYYIKFHCQDFQPRTQTTNSSYNMFTVFSKFDFYAILFL